MASKIHTWGNYDTEVLQSLEDPEQIFKKKDKEKVDISLFCASSSENFHSIFDKKKLELMLKRVYWNLNLSLVLKTLNSTLGD